MTNKVIKITNTSSGVPRLSLEKLGLSTKRNDPNSIGQFGSGIKYAPIAAIRMGLEWCFTGYDSNGPYTLFYDVEVEDGIKCIVYDYGDYKKTSSFTVDAGILSWEDEFQIYREAVSNAIDEASSNGGKWDRSIVFETDIKPVEGEFSVYITASPAMMEIYNEHDKHFLGERDPIYTTENIVFYEPYNSHMNVYTKTVRTFTNDIDGQKSLFDYEIPRIKLNEMRTISDKWDMQYQIGKGIVSCGDHGIIKRYLEASEESADHYEFQYIGSNLISGMSVNPEWLTVWNKNYGVGCILVNPIQYLQEGIITFIKEKGLRYCVQDSEMIYAILVKAGVKTIKDIAGEEIDYEIDTNINNYPKLVKAMKIAARFEPGLLNMKIPVAVFTSKQQEMLLGICIGRGTDGIRIMVEKTHALNGELNELVATLIHEHDHFETGIADGDFTSRKFRDLADRRIGKLMCSNYSNALVNVTNKSITVNIEDLAEVGGVSYTMNKAPLINGYIVNIGKINFAIENLEIENFQDVSGKMESSESGNSFHINYTSVSENPKVTVI